MKLRVVLRGGEVDREAKIVKMVEGFAPPFDEFRILFLYHAIQSNPPPPRPPGGGCREVDQE